MNFLALIKAASLVIQLLPVVTGFVKQFETEMVGATGSAKLAAVTAAVNSYLDKINAGADVIAAVQQQLGPLVGGLVTGFNASGVFQTNSKQSAPAQVGL